MSLLFLSTPARLAGWRQVFAAKGQSLIEVGDAEAYPAEITAIACRVPPADLARDPKLRADITVSAGAAQVPPLPGYITLAPGNEAMERDGVVMAKWVLHRD